MLHYNYVVDTCSRSTMGPALGGALAQPCDNYPTVFPRGTIFDHYPFLLPNLVCAAVLAIGVLIGILFLEETHGEKKHRRDPGIVAGRWILNHIGHRQVSAFAEKPTCVNLKDYNILVDDEPPPGYRTTEGSPRLPSSRAQLPSATRRGLKLVDRPLSADKPRSIEKAFTKQVILNIVAFGILA